MNFSHHKILLFCIFGLLLFSYGCTTTVAQPEEGLNWNQNQEIIQSRGVDTSFPELKRIIASDLLIGYISVVNPRIDSSGHFAKAQVTVQNLTQNRYSLEYQYQWEDSQGFEVGTPRPWKRFILGPKEAKNYSEMALSPKAIKTIFTVRVVDDTFIELNKELNNQMNK